MYWLFLLLLLYVLIVFFTYMIFYYESANGAHLETLRSTGSVAALILKAFLGSLYSNLLAAAITATTLHRGFWRLPPGPAARTPVIFVHGLYHNRTAWYFYMRWFRKWGWEHMRAVNLRGKFRCIRDYAEMLAGEMEQVLAETGSDRVDLVGHSMGGLVIRCYLAGSAAKAKVRKVVTLGTPHAGSKLAVFGVGCATKEMLPGSSFLESLNRAGDQLPDKGEFYCVYTVVDNMVLPNESARYHGTGATCLETRAVNHVGLVFCKQTARLVRRCLIGEEQSEVRS